MNHHHRKILHSLFAHPIAGNVAIKDVESVFQEMGGEVSETQAGKVHVVLNGHSVNFAHPQRTLNKDGVMQVRKFIETCGIDPERDYPL